MSQFKKGDKVVVTTKRFGAFQHLLVGTVVEVGYLPSSLPVSIIYDYGNDYFPAGDTNVYAECDLMLLELYNSPLGKALL